MPPITPAPSDIPDDEAENVPVPNENSIMIISDSDSVSDTENADHNGYELLSQDPQNLHSIENDVENCFSDSDVEDSDFSEFHSFNLIPAPLPNEDVIDDANECFQSEMPDMDEKHVETIKAVMKGITLPSSNLPHWANVVPEEEWKAALLSGMKTRHTNSRNKNERSSNNQFGFSYEVLR